MSGAVGNLDGKGRSLWAWHGRTRELMASMPEGSEERALLFQAAEVSLYESGLSEHWRLTAEGDLVAVDPLPEVRSA